ncbi:MAG: cysteine--tRNA ligase [Candidatus Thermoplasmatota archaeon]|nr:cysteine--tRNA ligase [Candidatus Thermoplasmatota archaeon]
MALIIHNTLTRNKQPFEPLIKGKVGIYVCGVTVYDHSHLGHAKSAINFDLIVRYLRYKGYDVTHITNFTDVDDKIIARANEMGIEPLELSRTMIEKYHKDMSSLKVKRADVYPKASETIPDMISMVSGLIERGYAYESNGSVYFSVSKAKEYGKLSGQSLDQMVAGARIEPGEDKRDPMDFALWKAAKPGEVFWESPWGKGRPGWHIECSAMCLKHIGKTVDIHGGGTDLVFPHHENEILQSEAYNDAPYVRYWMHNGMLTIDSEKMSKSLKNFFSIEDILKKYAPEVLRFFILNASYRAPLDYDEGSLDETKKALEKLQNSYGSMKNAISLASGTDDAKALTEKAMTDFEARMDDDFSSREAIAVMYDLTREANRLHSDGRLSKQGAENVVAVLDKFNDLFDVLTDRKTNVVKEDNVSASEQVSAEVSGENLDDVSADELADEGRIRFWVLRRETARKTKDFAYADRIRNKLAEFGIDIQDSKEGAVWKRK